ncbi:hypothetical protein J8J27_33265, partial [Mycobacterium tuberculosis]|nr:hypothetical protein [Mycobacterium tuberculosis]
MRGPGDGRCARPGRRTVLAALGAAAALIAGMGRGQAQKRRNLVVDEVTGLAIGGYDPVAY